MFPVILKILSVGRYCYIINLLCFSQTHFETCYCNTAIVSNRSLLVLFLFSIENSSQTKNHIKMIATIRRVVTRAAGY